LSVSLLGKIESGIRSVTPETIAAVAPVLRLSQAEKRQLMTLAAPDVLGLGLGQAEGSKRVPNMSELGVLDSSPFPACYMKDGVLAGALHVIVATNAAFDRLFVGLDSDVSVLGYELLNPVARDVFVFWEEDTHHMVQEFRGRVDRFVRGGRLEELKATLGQSPDFGGMWDDPIPAHLAARQTVWVRDVSDGTEFEMYFRVSRDTSPWLHWALTPVDVMRYLKRYPPATT
jgi:hypothetical protein